MFGLAIQLAINIKCEINDVLHARYLNYFFIFNTLLMMGIWHTNFCVFVCTAFR